MQPLMQQRMQELQGVAESSGVDPLFGSADVAMLLNPQLWDMMFYFC
jgi:putative hemolysin